MATEIVIPDRNRGMATRRHLSCRPIKEIKMKHAFSVLALLLVGGLSASAQNNSSISGTITYGTDRSPLHQVSVQLVEQRRTVSTDDDGKYSFTGLAAGKYTLKTHQEGFADITRTVEVAANSSVTIDFEMTLAGVREAVTITAAGTEQSTFEAIATVSSVDSGMITQRAAIGIGDVVESEAGVAKRSSGPGSSRPVLRGFDGDRVKIASDGISVGSLASQSGDHSEPVDVMAIERIEVVKGPATLLYGSNAIGGVVNAISGHDEGAHPGFRGYFSAIGSTNSSQASVSGGVEYGIKNWMFWGNASGQRSSDYRAGGNFGKVNNTFTRNATGNIGLGYFAKHAFFNGNFAYYQNRYGVPLDFNDPAPERRSLRVWRQDYKANFGLTDLHTFISAAKFTFDFSNYRHQEIADDVVGTTFRNRVYSIRSVFDQTKAGGLTGRFGFEAFHRNYSTAGTEVLINGPVKQDAFSVFGLEEYQFERVTLQFGGRIESNRYDPVNTALIDRDFIGLSGAVGARFALWKGGAFVANYSHSYRAPALEELYNHGPHDGTLAYEIGDPNLRAEVNNGIDLSLRQQNKRVKIEGNFYYYSIGNFVFLAPTGTDDPMSGLPIARYRQGNSRFYGSEFTADISLGRYVNLLTGIDYVNAALSDGRSLPRIPPFRARFGLDLHFKDFSLKPEFVAVGTQNRVFENETPTRGHSVFNINATYVIPQKHAAHVFFVNAFNLGNDLFFNHISFIKDISPEIGRGVKFGYTVRFF